MGSRDGDQIAGGVVCGGNRQHDYGIRAAGRSRGDRRCGEAAAGGWLQADLVVRGTMHRDRRAAGMPGAGLVSRQARRDLNRQWHLNQMELWRPMEGVERLSAGRRKPWERASGSR